jgi:hypothetical protein
VDDERSWWFTIQRSKPVDMGPTRGRYVELVPGTFRQTRNIDNDYLIDREMQASVNYTGLPTNRVQDTAITESMGTLVDRGPEHLGTSDVAIIFMRRLLIRMARQLQHGIEPAMLADAGLHYVLPIDVDSDEADLGALWNAHHRTLTSARAQTRG